MRSRIPVHKLTDRSIDGLEIIRFNNAEGMDEGRAPVGAHRDDHYIFIFQESGESSFMLDFKPLQVSGAAVMCIFPGQVHQAIAPYHVTGWFLALDTMLVAEEYRKVFEQYLLSNDPIMLDDRQRDSLSSCMALLYEKYQHIDGPMNKQIAYSLATSYIGMIASGYLLQAKGQDTGNSRPQQISGQFRSLLLLHFKSVKSPSAYAEMMNISAAYLNEAVKRITGFTVSYLIQHEIILEAKRLLYYTDLSIKEIAFELGFNDHTYFSRLFTATVGCSAGRFRAACRK
ncbi:MAG TPA: helix-turn-helix domain-containing protein [Pedobacter sp.]|nr:helix-turn-helix domain-containing protein [Pedobacter sp.]